MSQNSLDGRNPKQIVISNTTLISNHNPKTLLKESFFIKTNVVNPWTLAVISLCKDTKKRTSETFGKWNQGIYIKSKGDNIY